MNISYLFVILFLIYMLILVMYVLYSKSFNTKFNEQRIKLAKKTNKYFLDYKKKPYEQTDLVSYMFFLTSSLNEDAKKSKNYLLLDYNISYPRVFKTDASHIIKLTDALAQIMLLNLSNSTIIIKFLLSSYKKNQIKFTISVWANKNFAKECKKVENIHICMSEKSREFYRFAKKLASQNDSEIRFDFETQESIKISTDITLELSETKVDILKKLKIRMDNKFTALIAESNPYAFSILKNDLEFMGIDVKPTSDWDIIKRHVEDTIFSPNIIFVQAKLLKSVDIEEIKPSLVEKNIPLVIIQNDDRCIKIDPKIYVEYLTQPYTSDALISILNNTHEYRCSKNQN